MRVADLGGVGDAGSGGVGGGRIAEDGWALGVIGCGGIGRGGVG